MIQTRHSAIADPVLRHLEGESASPSLRAASRAATQLQGVQGFEVPQWRDVAAGLRPPDREREEHEPGGNRGGWQHEASSRLEQVFRAHSLFPQMGPSERAMVRSHHGPGAGVAFSASPSSLLTQIESPLFRVLLQRRLRLPLPLSQRFCGCGHPYDSLGHHRAACSRTGILGRRGFAVESAAARVCAEKQEVGWLPICSCASWIWGCRVRATTGVSRLWWTVCSSSTDGNWQLTPLWCQP